MKYSYVTEYMVEDPDVCIARSFAKSVKEYPVYVYSEWNNSFHASDSYIVATNEPTAENKLLAKLCINRRELLVAFKSLVEQRVKTAHELFKLSREY